jgi:uncharacterized protein YjbI with pentapeptide repeats
MAVLTASAVYDKVVAHANLKQTGVTSSTAAAFSITSGDTIDPSTSMADLDLSAGVTIAGVAYKATLNGVIVDGVDFSGTNLKGCTATTLSAKRANFRGCDLSQATLSGANFTGAQLTNATLKGSTGTTITLLGADVNNAVLQGLSVSAGTPFGA